MKRPKAHIVESASKKAFESIVPDEWACIPLNPDYGLDYMIQIFADEKATGKFFFVQLKGTDQEIKNDKVAIRVSLDHLEYWNSIPAPILLVFHSTQTNSFWAIWVNSFVRTRNTQEEQKGISITLDSSSQVDARFFRELTNDFNINIHKRVLVTTDSNMQIGTSYHSFLCKWLTRYYPHSIVFEGAQYARVMSITYKHKDNRLFITINDNSRGIYELEPFTVTDISELDALSHVNINAVPEMLIECLFLIATLLADIDVAASFGIYKSLFCTYRGKFKSPVVFLQLGFLSYRDRRLADYQELLLASLDCEQYDDFLMLNMYYMLCPERDEINVRGYYQSNWLTAISKLPDNNYKGMYCYNLANSYRADHFYYKAARYYLKARKLEPNYLTQSYWWRELGSCLFLTKHYSGAESCYRKSHELSEEIDPLLFALIGDCEFWQCKFKRALQSFQLYNKDTEKPSDEFLLKGLVCEQLVENDLSDIQRDQAKAIRIVNDAMSQEHEKTKYELLESAIRCDPLCHEAWYLMSVYHNNKDEPFKALFSTLICAAIREHDPGILLSAFYLSVVGKKFDLALLIVGMLKEKFSHDLKEIVEDFVSRQTIPNGLKPEAVLGLMNLFNQIDKGNQSETLLEISESLKNCIHISFE